MHAMLATILVLLGAAVVIVVVCRLVRLPPVLGYLLVGLLVGPHALGWVEDTPATRHLAEFGIVFLMFSLGLEFSLAQLKAMRRAVFGLGFAQVAITTVAGLIALTVVGLRLAGRSGARRCARDELDGDRDQDADRARRARRRRTGATSSRSCCSRISRSSRT